MNELGIEPYHPPSRDMIEVESNRAIAETQSSMVIAKRFPRDVENAYVRIIKACERFILADQSEYAYPRGGKTVTGPSIRLAEVIAQNWGNFQFGIRELSQTHGESEVEAFAWDIENNVRQIKTFKVPHKRYTKKAGNVDLTDPRDIYEYVANQGARRMRACILGVIPGDIIDAAVKKCRETVRKGIKEKPLEDQIRTTLKAFDSIGVTTELIEKRLGHKASLITEDELIELNNIGRSIKDNMTGREEWFDIKGEQQKQADDLTSSIKKDEDPDPFINESLSSGEQIAPKKQDKIYKGQDPAKYRNWVVRNWSEAVDVATPISSWKKRRMIDVQDKWVKMGLLIQNFPSNKPPKPDKEKVSSSGEGQGEAEPTLDAETQEFLANAQGFYEELHESGEWDRVLKAFAIENPKDLEANMRRAFLQTCNARLDKLNEKKGQK